MFYVILAVLAALVIGFVLGVFCADRAWLEKERTDAAMRAGMKSAERRGWLDR